MSKIPLTWYTFNNDLVVLHTILDFPLFSKFNFCFMVDLEGERKKQSATEKVVENNGKSITG